MSHSSASHYSVSPTASTSKSSSSTAYPWSDTDSLLSITDTIREELFRIEGQNVYHSLDHPSLAYPVVSDTSELNRIRREMLTWGRETPGQLNWEPREGMVDRALAQKPGDQTRVLKLGRVSSGLDSWSVPMATAYPWAEVIHLSPSPNLSVEIGSFHDGLNFPDEFFDLVDASLTCGQVPDFEVAFLGECLRVLKPGGALVLIEYDTVCRSGPNRSQLIDLILKRDAAYDAAIMGSTWETISSYLVSIDAQPPSYNLMGNWCKKIGFTDVYSRRDTFDLTSNDGHPNMAGLGRRFFQLSWDFARENLRLDRAEEEEMRALDVRLVEECPPGLLTDYYSCLAFKAADKSRP